MNIPDKYKHLSFVPRACVWFSVIIATAVIMILLILVLSVMIQLFLGYTTDTQQMIVYVSIFMVLVSLYLAAEESWLK